MAALGPLLVLTALAGCTLSADLDSLTAQRRKMDAAPMAGPPDALPGADVPARPDGDAIDAPAIADTRPSSADVPLLDAGAPEDAALGPAEDRPADNATPDAPVTEDAKGYDGVPGGGSADATTPVDGQAGPDGAADAVAMCPRSPSRYATLYLMNSNSTTTGCGYSRASLSGHLAGVDPATFDGSAACGACVRIETPSAVVVAQVAELGPRASGENPTAVTVNRAALTLLAPDGSTFIEQGVSWRFVPCPLPAASGMTFQFQDGSSANYAALLIQNHRYRLASVEYWSNGRYRTLARASYNHWVASNGMGSGPFTLRITDVHGHSVEQTGVPLRPGTVFRGQAQFPECSND